MQFLNAINVVFDTVRIFELLGVKLRKFASVYGDRPIKLLVLKRNTLKSLEVNIHGDP